MTGKERKIALLGLIGIVMSACIGSGAFALTGQLANVASPGAIILAWVVVAFGFGAFALSLSRISSTHSGVSGIFGFALEGFGPFSGFISGWGYWLSGVLGNVALAVMMVQSLGFFFPVFLSGNSLLCTILISIIFWLVIAVAWQGMENAAVFNSMVMIAKIIGLAMLIIFTLLSFRWGIFTADFWGTMHDNLVSRGEAAGQLFGSLPKQIANCLLITMWAFIGIEGAAVLSSRAKKPGDAGKATVLGLLGLLVVYVGVSVLPYGVIPYEQVAALKSPATVYLFEIMMPQWGGAFISIVTIVSIAGTLLSFTLLTVETAYGMSKEKLLPGFWAETNANGAATKNMIAMGICFEGMLAVNMLSADAFATASNMCTVTVIITWFFAAAWELKLGVRQRNAIDVGLGAISCAFLAAGIVLKGWGYLLVSSVVYLPGFVLYAKARKDAGVKLAIGEIVAALLCIAMSIVSLVLVATGAITL